MVCSASAASTLALKKPSSVPLRTGLPRSSPIRCSRRASPRKTKNTGEAPIHGMAGNSAPIAARFAGSVTRRIDACWKSDLAEALKRGGDQQIEQALGRNGVAVAPHGLARDHTADEFVVGVAARRTAVAKAPVYRRCVKRHSLETFIANSPYRRRNPGIGENPSANFLATEVSRDFSRRVPSGFLPHGWQLLDQPSETETEP